jgi:acyl-CoA reductase-like NAD-dependent aldehyde dehydrogenase
MIQGYDPRTGKPAGEPVAETTDSAVDAIAEAAAAARPGWEAMGPAGRAAALRAVADALDAQAGELAAVADTETALGSTRLTGEVARTTGQLRMFADVLADGGYLDLITSPPAQGVPGLRRMVRPLGPVAVFSASNFPFAFSVAGGDTASALAAGCPVVVKAHEGHPQTSVATARIVTAALAAHPAVTLLATGQPGEGPWAATPQAFLTSLDDFTAGLPDLAGERFGPAGLVITYPSVDALLPVLGRLGGNLAGSIHADPASAADLAAAAPVADVFTRTVGRVIWNGWPTGVAVTWAQHHGGPFPATTSPHYTSVGATAIRRWLVPVTYQDFPAELLPGALRALR